MFNTVYDKNQANKNYDLVVECFGYKFRTDFMRKNFAKSLAPNGQIYVNDLLQVSGVDPSYEPFAPALKDNIFALGDVN